MVFDKYLEELIINDNYNTRIFEPPTEEEKIRDYTLYYPMYKYQVRQGKSQVTLNLPCDQQQPLLFVLGAFFYHQRKAKLVPPLVFQDGAQVLEEQVAEEFEKLKTFLEG